MSNIKEDLTTLFAEAKQKNEFEFVLTLINYRGIGGFAGTSNLHEWYSAIEFYKGLYYGLSGKEKTRIGTLIYSLFFESSDFYNIIGSLCRIKLGYKGSSFLFWKTKKYEKLLGIGQKQDFLLELLLDANKPNIVKFFDEIHFKEIRNTFFHSAYSLEDDEYILHDSDPIMINNHGVFSFDVNEFLYPKIENVIFFFDTFKALYLESFSSYKENKLVDGYFPYRVRATILGSAKGLGGFKISNGVSFYGRTQDSGVWYDERLGIWAGYNIRINFESIEDIEISEQLDRYANKDEIKKSDLEFSNLVDKIVDRGRVGEISKATQLLIKFGDAKFQKVQEATHLGAQKGFANITIRLYQKAIEVGAGTVDLTEPKARLELLKKL